MNPQVLTAQKAEEMLRSPKCGMDEIAYVVQEVEGEGARSMLFLAYAKAYIALFGEEPEEMPCFPSDESDARVKAFGLVHFSEMVGIMELSPAGRKTAYETWQLGRVTA